MTGFIRTLILLFLLGFLLSLFTFSASVPDPAPVTETAVRIPPVLTQAPAEHDAVLTVLAEPPEEPAEIIEEIPPASYVSSLVPMTGSLPVIEPRTNAPVITPERQDGRIVLPSLIGYRETDLYTLSTDSFTVMYAHDWYPLPEGVVYAASFMGEMTEDEFRILPDSTLTLHVSKGMDPDISHVEKGSKTVYLTFDDGPHAVNTEAILDTLDEYGIKATFFTVGSYVEKRPEVIRVIYERGHKIGCHSYTHEYAHIYESAENMMAEIERWESAVKAAIGFVPPERLFRYPGGSSTCKNEEVHDALLRAGYRIFDWNMLNNDCLIHTRPKDMSDLDFMKQSVIETAAYSLSLKTTPHILLMHDSYAQTAELLAWIIEYLQSLGCSFATPDELPAGWFY